MRVCTLCNRLLSGKGFWVRSVRLETGEIHVRVFLGEGCRAAVAAVGSRGVSMIARDACGDNCRCWP
jgi:hypothetical protein